MTRFLAVRFRCPAGVRFLGPRGALVTDLASARLFPVVASLQDGADRADVDARDTAARFAGAATLDVLRSVGASSLDQAAEVLARPEVVPVIRRTVVELAETEPSA